MVLTHKVKDHFYFCFRCTVQESGDFKHIYVKTDSTILILSCLLLLYLFDDLTASSVTGLMWLRRASITTSAGSYCMMTLLVILQQ